MHGACQNVPVPFDIIKEAIFNGREENRTSLISTQKKKPILQTLI
jgi:hypothetical protein